jgi:hypothetical protein
VQLRALKQLFQAMAIDFHDSRLLLLLCTLGEIIDYFVETAL